MPMIFESPRTYDMQSPVPYWLPQNSLGSTVAAHSTDLQAWLQNKRMVAETNEPPIDYRPTLHRIHQSDQFLGLRELFVSDAVELVVYLPLLDRLMLEKRKASGIIQTAIYRANSVDGFRGFGWEQEYESNWRFTSRESSSHPSYDGVMVDDNVPTITPSYKTYIFMHQSSTNNQPQEEAMQEPTQPVENLLTEASSFNTISEALVANHRAAMDINLQYRHPMPYEFSTRIMQGDRMMTRLKHAVLVLAVNRVQSAMLAPRIPTGAYPDSEVAAARATLQRFFDAIANSMESITASPDRHDRVIEMISEIQEDVVVRANNTDFHMLWPEYNGMRDTYAEVRDAVRKLIFDFLLDVSTKSGEGLFALEYAMARGRLRRADSMRLHHVRSILDSLLSLGTNDHDEMTDHLECNGYTMCQDCGDWELEDALRTPYNHDEGVCRSCLNSDYVYSDYYDDYIYRGAAVTAIDRYGDEVTIHENDEEFMYDDNMDRHRHRDYEYRAELIASYHSTKRHGFKFIESDWVKRNDRFIGVELEIECRSDRFDAVERLNNKLNDGDIGRKVWFENDGSLSDSGFEMITNPMGLDTHADFWEWLQDKELVRHLRSHDTSTCGLHVHVSRKNLHDLQLNRMNVFINHPDNAPLVKAVARRYATNYARIRDKQMGKAHYAIDRYDALNLENDKTVEFRIFKGTLKHGSLMAALEFANAVVNFTAPASPAGFNLSTDRFIRFIADPTQRSETRYLRSYLKESGLIA